MISVRKWGAARTLYGRMGGEHAEEIYKMLPAEMAEDSAVSARTIALAMLAAYKAGHANIIVATYSGNPFDEIISLSDAAEVWGVSRRVLINYCRFSVVGEEPEESLPCFRPGEAKKYSGKIWLVTRSAMRRLFGDPCQKRTDGIRGK